jgi:hypothetical protein
MLNVGGRGSGRRALLASTLGLLVAFGCSDADLVNDYCNYGAVSRAQRDGCAEHVSPGDVDRLETNAARYAQGELDRCLADAGPFCRDR